MPAGLRWSMVTIGAAIVGAAMAVALVALTADLLPVSPQFFGNWLVEGALLASPFTTVGSLLLGLTWSRSRRLAVAARRRRLLVVGAVAGSLMLSGSLALLPTPWRSPLLPILGGTCGLLTSLCWLLLEGWTAPARPASASER